MKHNEAVYRSPKWLRNFVDYEVNTGEDIKGEPSKKRAEANKLKEWDDKWDDILNKEKNMFSKFLRMELNLYAYSDTHLNEFKKEFRGDLSIFKDYEIFSKKEKEADIKWAEYKRKEKEANERWAENVRRNAENERKKAERDRNSHAANQRRINNDLEAIYVNLEKDFTSSPYVDKIKTNYDNVSKKTNAYYTFNNGNILKFEDNKLTYNRLVYTLGPATRNKFIKLINYIIKNAKSRNSSSGSKSSSWQNHPKADTYSSLKKSISIRKEQLAKMKTGSDKKVMENELLAAEAMLKKMKDKYHFEHISSFKEYIKY